MKTFLILLVIAAWLDLLVAAIFALRCLYRRLRALNNPKEICWFCKGRLKEGREARHLWECRAAWDMFEESTSPTPHPITLHAPQPSLKP